MNALRLSQIDIITWKICGRLTGGLLLVSLGTLPLGAQQRAAVDRLRPVEKSARVIERGPHHARWETVRDVTDPATGETIASTNSYVQLETGLHVQDARGQWQLASEQIEVLPGEAVARGGQHKVRWAANINTRGAIELTTPEGELARSHVLGIAYVDPATGTSAMIADIKDSNGAVGGWQPGGLSGCVRWRAGRFAIHIYESRFRAGCDLARAVA